MNNKNSLSNSQAADMMSQLGNLTRLQILRLLVRAEPLGLNVGAIQQKLKVPASTLSHHLAGLCRARLVIQQREGAARCCRVNMQRLEQLTAFLTDECCAGVD